MDPGVQSGTTYFYVVTAVDSSNVESTYSNQATAAIP
jgi:fibronectin type 3 domain-containing protein